MSTLRQFCLALVAVGAGVIYLTLSHTKPSIFGGALLLGLGAAGYVATGLIGHGHSTDPKDGR